MAISKRLRYEILRRDNHACRYCGGVAPDVALTVDHVVPVALGGSDDPTNLVAACKDCNAGKSSVPADSKVVDNVAADAERWAQAMRRAAELRNAELAMQEQQLDHFEGIWTAYWMNRPKANDTSTAYRHPGRWYAPQPNDWKRSILTFINAGLDMDFFTKAVRQVLHDNQKVDWEDCWRYFCGVCWRELEHRREIAYSLLDTEE